MALAVPLIIAAFQSVSGASARKNPQFAALISAWMSGTVIVRAVMACADWSVAKFLIGCLLPMEKRLKLIRSVSVPIVGSRAPLKAHRLRRRLLGRFPRRYRGGRVLAYAGRLFNEVAAGRA